MKVRVSQLKQWITDIHANSYYTKEEAEQIADVYLFAELTNKNMMGIVKLMGTEPSQSIKPKSKPSIIKETPASVLVDGGGNPGPLAAQFTTQKVIEKASQTGFAIGGSNNTFSSTAAISYYVYKMAKAGLIGIVGAGSPAAIVPPNGKERVFGTNPIAFAFPTQEQPIVFDMASAAIAYSGLVRARTLGETIPEGMAVDKDGNSTTDPGEAMNGGILPFDRSYKGFGLALIVELLTGPLTGASYVFDDGSWGTFFMAFKPDLLVDLETFKERTSDLVQKVKAKQTKDGSEIRIPGYDRLQQYEDALANDSEIELEEVLVEKIKAML